MAVNWIETFIYNSKYIENLIPAKRLKELKSIFSDSVGVVLQALVPVSHDLQCRWELALFKYWHDTSPSRSSRIRLWRVWSRLKLILVQ